MNRVSQSIFVDKSIVDQVRTAAKPHYRVASVAGFLLGGFIPIATYFVAHHEVTVDKALWQQMPALLVIGGLIFSAKTVFDWAKTAFRHPAKALGFVCLMEGVMTFSSSTYLAVAALVYLVLINGIATGCNLALDQKKGKK